MYWYREDMIWTSISILTFEKQNTPKVHLLCPQNVNADSFKIQDSDFPDLQNARTYEQGPLILRNPISGG